MSIADPGPRELTFRLDIDPAETVRGWTRRVIGIALVTVGAVVVMGALLALLDPSIKLSDDGDPFGPAPSLASALIGLAAGFLLAATGLWLALASQRRSVRETARVRVPSESASLPQRRSP